MIVVVNSWGNVAYLPIILASMIFKHTIGMSLNKAHKNKNKGRADIDNVIHSDGVYFAIP